jgi:hypothetical protein
MVNSGHEEAFNEEQDAHEIEEDDSHPAGDLEPTSGGSANSDIVSALSGALTESHEMPWHLTR